MACLIAAGCMTDNAQNKELPMQAELFIDGGVGFFPGLARPIVLDENALSAEERDELARLVSAARAEPVARARRHRNRCLTGAAIASASPSPTARKN